MTGTSMTVALDSASHSLVRTSRAGGLVEYVTNARSTAVPNPPPGTCRSAYWLLASRTVRAEGEATPAPAR